MKFQTPKVSIIGADKIGTRYAYTLILEELAREIVLIDEDKKKAEGEVIDLSHCSPYSSSFEIYAGDFDDLIRSDLIVITIGENRKENVSKLKLAKKNIKILKKIIPKILEHAPSAPILISTNPVDIMSYYIFKKSNRSFNTIIGTGTVLETARLRTMISDFCNILSKNVHTYILGERGDNEFPVWSKAMIGGILIKNNLGLCEKPVYNGYEKFKNLFEKVKNSDYKILNKKGKSSFGISLALTRITRAILNNENAILPVSTLVNNYHSVNNVYMSIPAVINNLGIRKRLHIELSDDEIKKLKNSYNSLKKLIDKLDI